MPRVIQASASFGSSSIALFESAIARSYSFLSLDALPRLLYATARLLRVSLPDWITAVQPPIATSGDKVLPSFTQRSQSGDDCAPAGVESSTSKLNPNNECFNMFRPRLRLPCNASSIPPKRPAPYRPSGLGATETASVSDAAPIV